MMIEVAAYRDETGELEEFTWDLFPLMEGSQTLHLDDSGLPKPGTLILPGTIIVGKIGRSRYFDGNLQPNCLEVHGLEFGELRSKFGHMWKDASLYADDAICGIVQGSYFRETQDSLIAVVEIEPMDTREPGKDRGEASETLS